MTPLITFIDTGVLIAAARGQGKIHEAALKILKDPDREFSSSPFLKLEVLPKAVYNCQDLEVDFYQTYFDAVTHWANDLDSLVSKGYEEMIQFGLGAMDALHVAAAVSVGSDEFITSEKRNKSIFRTTSIQMVSIHL